MPAGRMAAAALTLLTLACGDAPVVECYAPADGVPVVRNRGDGVWAEAGTALSLKQLWRRGGSTEGQSLAYPAGAAPGRSGRLAIVDFQLGELIVIGSGGEWHGPWATRGPGPGELTAPVAAAWVAEDTVAVFDIGAAELELVARDGARSEAVPAPFVAPVVASGQVHWAAVDERGGTYLKVTAPVPDDPGLHEQAIVRHARAGQTDTLLRLDVPVASVGRFRGVPRPGFPTALASVGGEHVFLADPGGRYLVTVLDPRGDPVRHICRASPAFPLTRSELGADTLPERWSELAAAFEAGPRPERPAAIGRMVAGPGGRLWVQRERGTPWDGDAALYGVAGATHDVFDADGRYMGTVALPEGFRLQAVLGDTIWGFRRGQLDEVWVEAYEIKSE